MHNTLTKKAILKSKADLTFNLSKTIITISVGQPNHEGDKLYATLLAADRQFSFARIMVCDSLQRYTMKITSNLTLEQLHLESIKLGDEWIARNLKYIKTMNIPYELSRWNEWLNHPDYTDKLQIIEELYNRDTLFKNSIFSTTHGFISRNSERLVINKEQAYELSKDYLLEECAVMLILADEGYEFEIYPNQRNEALDYIYHTIIAKENSHLMQAVSIKFKNLIYTANNIEVA
ncbi:MAG: hypothetical protein H0T84_00840 [Tatlockia sp.]|nr:hypothetical protein [Tatlockia sp.]